MKFRVTSKVDSHYFVRKRGVEVLEISYKAPTKEETKTVVEKVLSALAERGLKF